MRVLIDSFLRNWNTDGNWFSVAVAVSIALVSSVWALVRARAASKEASKAIKIAEDVQAAIKRHLDMALGRQASVVLGQRLRASVIRDLPNLRAPWSIRVCVKDWVEAYAIYALVGTSSAVVEGDIEPGKEVTLTFERDEEALVARAHAWRSEQKEPYIQNGETVQQIRLATELFDSTIWSVLNRLGNGVDQHRFAGEISRLSKVLGHVPVDLAGKRFKVTYQGPKTRMRAKRSWTHGESAILEEASLKYDEWDALRKDKSFEVVEER